MCIYLEHYEALHRDGLFVVGVAMLVSSSPLILAHPHKVFAPVYVVPLLALLLYQLDVLNGLREWSRVGEGLTPVTGRTWQL